MPSDYQRIEQAIHWITQHADQQPELADIARFLGLSPYHTQRMFTRWAGVSPKQFLQYLTVDHAKKLLDDSQSVLTASLEAGLSSPSRLHDQMVNIEAITPGEYKLKGEGLEIQYGFHQTPFGQCLVATTPRGICHLAFTAMTGQAAALEQLQGLWPNTVIHDATPALSGLVQQIFSFKEERNRGLRLLVRGTNFQVKVWEALLRIPPGCAMTYGDIAEHIGSHRAARAVGSAVAKNRLAYLIPCHRVIRGSGIIGDYHWGSDRKRAIIAWESAHSAMG
ncbi:MAG: methylated-DNA--[protein]-cysteine S-methyltransferase [Candidatus Sedimenticola sp. PURPLELP]